jgi:hypothetical protein
VTHLELKSRTNTTVTPVPPIVNARRINFLSLESAVELGFTVPDIQKLHQDLSAKGVHFTMPPTKQDFGSVLAAVRRLGRWLSQHRCPPADILFFVKKRFRVSIDWLLTGEEKEGKRSRGLCCRKAKRLELGTTRTKSHCLKAKRALFNHSDVTLDQNLELGLASDFF